jgi:bla regulator protein blaR1
MTNAVWIRDVGAFSLQVAALVLAGAGVAFLCQLRQPGAMLAFWRTLLLACLALPFCQPWHVRASAVMSAMPAGPVLSSGAAATALSLRAVPAASLAWGEMLLVFVCAGAALRVVWLLMGALTLRRLRLGAAPLVPMPPPIREAQLRVGARGDILVSDRVSGPMTFGLLRPVILLPPDVGDMAPHVQEAMAYHELIHVQRRDWVAELLEEGIRTVLWFHPAVWWLIGRIRLSREQVVDEAVVRLTQSREQYVDALLVVALRKSPFTLAPAPTFFRRSLLKRRVAHIMQETTMTTYRLIASLTTGAVVVGLAGVFAVRSFPLEAQTSATVATGDPVQAVRGADHLMQGRLPEYPGRALKQQVEGEVVLDVAVDDRGEVSDARVLTGPDELRRAALESVLQWHYAPAEVSNRSIQVVLQFHLPAVEIAPKESEKLPEWAPNGEDVTIVSKDGRSFKLRRDGKEPEEKEAKLLAHQQAEHMMMEMEVALKDLRTPLAEREALKQRLFRMKEELEARRGFAERESKPGGGTSQLVRVRAERLPDSMVGEILARAGLAVGDVVSEESLKRVHMIAAQTDEHIEVEFGHDEKGGVVLTFVAR